MKDLVEHIAKTLVADPDGVSVEVKTDEEGVTVYELQGPGGRPRQGHRQRGTDRQGDADDSAFRRGKERREGKP